YLAIIGGTAALETTWVEAIEDVDLDDLNPESLWKFRVRNFGPLLVAMDSHGGSLYSKVKRTAQERRAAALRRLGVRENRRTTRGGVHAISDARRRAFDIGVRAGRAGAEPFDCH